MKLLEHHRLRDQEEKTWAGLHVSDGFRAQVEAALADPAALCDLYRSAAADERAFIRSRVDRPLARKVMSYAYRSPIGEALVAHAIANLANGDARDTIMLLQSALVFEYPDELRKAAEIAGPAMAAIFLDLSER